MSTPIVMPQMGESIAEGTIVRWIKKVGDTVDRDEPLFEISTDKVDAEIPSPAAGVLTEITVKEGETVAVNAVVGMIGEPLSPGAAPPSSGQGRGSRRPGGTAAARQKGASSEPAASLKEGAATAAASTQPQPDGAASATAPEAATAMGNDVPPAVTTGDLRRQKSSPLVRRIAREHHVDITRIQGSGVGGRVTKHDILRYLASGTDQEGREESGVGSPKQVEPIEIGIVDSGAPQGDEIRPLSVMRRKIAEHMVLSRRTSAHVHSVFHVNFSTVAKIRQQRKGDYERLGAKLTYMPFIAKAVIDALRRHPVINASLDDGNVIYKRDINIGIAVALEGGLIVPVIKHADEKNLLGLSRAIADVAERARGKQLKPEEVHGGTFTITNPGQFGAQFGMPIINQPEVAILAVGAIEKRPVVIDDAIGIRTMAYLTLGYDHRLVDGAVADHFMADVKNQIESFDSEQV
jgi:pyruvate dehydrogenase E2 component (dihydrolipoamide acetyltransferase)